MPAPTSLPLSTAPKAPRKSRKTNTEAQAAAQAAKQVRDQGLDLAEALVDRPPRPDELAPNEDARCQYSSKKCPRVRAVKRQGILHKLCEFHRAKAILNQRRLELRKQARKYEAEARVATRLPPAAKKRRVEHKQPVLLKREPRDDATTDPVVIKNEPTDDTTSSTTRSIKNEPTNVVMLAAITVPSADALMEPHPKFVPAYDCDTFAYLSPREVYDIEPCRTPATLYPEDLEELTGLVDGIGVADVEAFTWDYEF